MGLVFWATDVWAAFAELRPVSLISLGRFFSGYDVKSIYCQIVSICPGVSSILGILFKKNGVTDLAAKC